MRAGVYRHSCTASMGFGRKRVSSPGGDGDSHPVDAHIVAENAHTHTPSDLGLYKSVCIVHTTDTPSDLGFYRFSN